MIPKTIHQIWVGNDPRPRAEMDAWSQQHSACEYRRCMNCDYELNDWITAAQMEVFARRGRWEGVADLMRYEILLRYGGIYLDADLACERPLDDWLLDCPAFAVYESEQHRPGCVANGILGFPAGHPAMRQIVEACAQLPPSMLEHAEPWQTVGPAMTTRLLQGRRDVTVLPSVLFLPQHYLDAEPRQSSLTYASHAWTTTRKTMVTA